MPASTTASSCLAADLHRDERRKHAIDFLVAARHQQQQQQQHTRLLSDISLVSNDSSSLTTTTAAVQPEESTMWNLPTKRIRDISPTIAHLHNHNNQYQQQSQSPPTPETALWNLSTKRTREISPTTTDCTNIPQPNTCKRTRLISDLSVPLPNFEFGPGQGLLPPPPPHQQPPAPLVAPPASSYEAALSLASLPMAQPILGNAFMLPPFNYDLFRSATTIPTNNAAPAPATGIEFVPFETTTASSTTTPPPPRTSGFDQLLPSSSPVTQINCGECKLEFPDGSSLSAHARACHPSKPYPCLVCGRCFGEKGNMNKHHRTVHLKQRKHSCATCGRSFAFMDGLNRHIAMVHLDRRPFECTFCQCPDGRHDESVACTHICGMRFKQKSHRRRHVRSVHQATR